MALGRRLAFVRSSDTFSEQPGGVGVQEHDAGARHVAAGSHGTRCDTCMCVVCVVHCTHTHDSPILACPGLASCAMEGFDAKRVAGIIGLPASFAIPAVVALGLPDVSMKSSAAKPRPGGHSKQQSPRFALADSVSADQFGKAWPD